MPAITFYKHEPIPMEMHKVKIVQQLQLLPTAQRLQKMQQAGFNTFQLHNGDIFLDMLTDSGVNAMSDLQQSAMLRADDAYAGSETFFRMRDKLEELFELCDRVEVIRDGEFIATKPIDQWDNDSLITAMVGRSLDNQFPKEFGEKSKEPMLEVDNVVEAGVLNDVSFKAYGGQILGFAGLVGAGRTEIMRAVFGADPIDSGKIKIKGKEVHIKSPRQAIHHGIAFLTEDRKGQGLVLAQTIRTKPSLPCKFNR